MADTVDVHYIYPPNWQDAPNVSDDQYVGWKEIVVHLTCLSDGTGESDVKKVDISELRAPNGDPVKKTAVQYIKYNVVGMTVTLEWDHAPSALIARLDSGEGEIDWCKAGGKVDPSENTDVSGDIILSTSGADAGDTYDITMKIKLKG